MIKFFFMRFVYAFLIIILVDRLSGQYITDPYCGSNIVHDIRLSDPSYSAEFYSSFEMINDSCSAYYNSNLGTYKSVEVLPVVVHVFTPPGTPIGSGNNLTNEEIEDGLAYLNEAFSNSNNFVTSDGVDVEIQFCLAQRTPDNQPTNGITRHEHAVVAGNDCGSGDNSFEMGDETVLMNEIYWPPCDYINIYLVTNITQSTGMGCMVAGYATLGMLNGYIVQESVYWNTIGGTQVTAHEMGHFFGLWHTWQGGCQNDDCLMQGDLICDTPPDNETFNVCNANSCNTDSPDLADDTRNYMDYTTCNPLHFTQGQKERMNITLNTVQSCLLNSMGCDPPCENLVSASLTASDSLIDVGSSVNFIGNATNDIGVSYRIDNGPVLASSSNYSHLFTAIGSYWVSFTASSGDPLCLPASDSLLITVECNVDADFNANNYSINEGETVVLTNTSDEAFTYQWFVNNIPVSSSENYNYTFTTPGSYYVCLEASGIYCDDVLCKVIGVASITAPAGCQGNSFQKMYGWELDDYGVGIVTDNDDGFVIVGYTGSSDFPFDGLIIKTSPTGDVVWTKVVGEYQSEEIVSDIIKTADGGYVVCGRQSPPNAPACQGFPTRIGFIMKIDAMGNPIWKTKIDANTANGEAVLDIAEDANNNILYVGVTDNGCSVVNTMVGMLDQSGNNVWCKNFANSNGSSDWPAGIIIDNNDEIVITGTTRSNQGEVLYNNWHNAYLLKLSGNGDLLYSHEYYGVNGIAGSNEGFAAPRLLSNGNYLVSVVQTPLFDWSTNAGPASSALLELAATNGDINWQISFVLSSSAQATVLDCIYSPSLDHIGYVWNDASPVLMNPLANGIIGIGVTDQASTINLNRQLGFGTLYEMDLVGSNQYVSVGVIYQGNQRDILLSKVNAELETPGCESELINTDVSSNYLVKINTGWTITDMSGFVFPNFQLQVQNALIQEAGVLCEAPCEEICDNFIDDNQNGQIDEGCECPVMNVTHDANYCYGDQLQLLATYGFDHYEWTPSVGLSDPTIYNPILTIGDINSYQVSGYFTGPNLVYNGNFELGNSYFDSDYNYTSFNNSEGQYYVSGNPVLWNGLLSACNDHTTGSGNMLMVNGSNTVNELVWKQILMVAPNTTYKYSVWIQSLHIQNTAQLKFFVNGAEIPGSINAGLPTCNWIEFFTTYTTGPAENSVILSIVNANTMISGNDFALDDISFQKYCRDSTEVIFNTLRDSLIYSQGITCLEDGKIVITAEGGIPPYQYQLDAGTLQSDGVFNNLNGGNYTVTTTDAAGCTLSENISLVNNNTPIDINIINLEDESCNGLGEIEVEVFGNGEQVQYNFFNDTVQAFGHFQNIEAGDYWIIAINEFGCRDSINFTIANAGVSMFNLMDTICAGDVLNINNHQYDETGIYMDTLVNQYGCDSILTIELLVLAPYEIFLDSLTCDIADTMTLVQNMVSVQGCDSIVTTHIRLMTLEDCESSDCLIEASLSEDCVCVYTPILIPDCEDGSIFTTDYYDMLNCECVHEDIPQNILIPTAFSPNGDGVNDYFRIHSSGFSSYDLKVYNRWGNLIFESNVPDRVWDGRIGILDAPIETYIFYFEYALTQEPELMRSAKGNVTLIR